MGKGGSKHNHVPEDVEEYLLRCTNFTARELKKWYKTFMKYCPQERMTTEQFIKIYTYFFTEGDASAFAKHVFRTFDKNNDGTIDFKEFMSGLSITMHGQRDDKLRWAFNMMDIDNSGSITADELVDLIVSIYKLMGQYESDVSTGPKAEQLADHLFSKMDVDSDGGVTLEEFVNTAKDDDDILALFQQC